MKKEHQTTIIVVSIIAILTALFFAFKKQIDKGIYYVYNTLTTPFKYFTYSEFDSPDAPGSGQKFMNKAFIEKLDIAREKAGIPFNINSGYRTATQNIEVGGVPNSAHTLGLAADISTPTEEIKKKVAKALYEAGFIRIGFANTFLHVDDDKTKPQVAFNYDGAHIYTYSELA